MAKKLIEFKPAHWKFNVLYRKKTYKVFNGGRGGMKSWECAKALVYYMKRFDGLFAVVCRETEVSLKHSAQKLIWDTIKRFGLEGEFENILGMIRHRSNGSFVIFKGIGSDPDSIKSMEGADIVWVEEAQTISAPSLEMLIPTIIRKEGAEVWFTYNQRFSTDPVYEMFVDGHPLAEIHTISYLENPFLPSTFIAEAEEMKRKNPALYDHIYMGSCLDASSLLMVSNIQFGVAQSYPNDIVICGCDIARDGGDATTIYVRKGRNIVHTARHYNMDLDKLSMELQDVNRRFHPTRINIDSTGHGAWCADGLRRAGLTNVFPINFSESAWQEDLYSNKRTNLYALANQFFEGGGVIPVGSTQLEKELRTSRYLFDSKNRPRMIPKDEYKKVIGHSTDDSDGFVLCLYTGTKEMFIKPMPNQLNPALEMSKIFANNARR